MRRGLCLLIFILLLNGLFAVECTDTDGGVNYFKKGKVFLFTSLTGKKSVQALKKAVRYARKKRTTVIANPSINMIEKRKQERN